MEEASATRYWCHICSLIVNPVMETEITCPFCQSGFVEEMEEDPNSEIHRRRIRHAFANIRRTRAGLTLEFETESNLHREPLILINPLNQTVIDPGFELVRQRIIENDLSRYGTPPACKEAIEALVTVKIDETLECSVCLDDFDIGTEAKQMPCKHKFHGDCLFPWLQRHSSCPLCRYQLPKAVRDNNATATNSHGSENNNGRNDGNRLIFSIQRQFSLSDFFSLSQDSNQSTDGS